MSEYPIHASKRHLCRENVNLLLSYVAGDVDSPWFIDLLGGQVMEAWTGPLSETHGPETPLKYLCYFIS
jgi:hypothetical protein